MGDSMKKQKYNYWQAIYQLAKKFNPIDRKGMRKYYKGQIVIEEVARIALEDRQYRTHLKHELGLSNKQMNDAYRHLCSLLKKGKSK